MQQSYHRVGVLMTVLGWMPEPHFGWWNGGPGKVGTEVAKAGAMLSPRPAGRSRCASSRQPFQLVQSRGWNTDLLGKFLAQCCWQLLLLPLMSPPGWASHTSGHQPHPSQAVWFWLGLCPLWVLIFLLCHEDLAIFNFKWKWNEKLDFLTIKAVEVLSDWSGK